MLCNFPVVLTTDPGVTDLDHKLKVIHERKRAGKRKRQSGSSNRNSSSSSRDRMAARSCETSKTRKGRSCIELGHPHDRKGGGLVLLIRDLLRGNLIAVSISNRFSPRSPSGMVLSCGRLPVLGFSLPCVRRSSRLLLLYRTNALSLVQSHSDQPGSSLSWGGRPPDTRVKCHRLRDVSSVTSDDSLLRNVSCQRLLRISTAS